MSSPLISVILPIYNIEAYLGRCMEAVLHQTYENLEILMVDDGSPDGCPAICDAYAQRDPRVRALHKENGGLSDARNYGIAHSTGEYIACIDPDDYVDLDYIGYLYGLIEKYGTKMSVCQHLTEYDSGAVKDHGSEGDECLEIETCLRRMLYHDVIDTSAWGKLYHRSLFDTVLYPKGKIFEDIGTTYALMIQCESGIAVGYEAKYHYMYHMNSIVNSSFSPRKLDLLEMTDKMGRDVINAYPSLKQAVLRRRVYARFSTLNQMLHTEGYDEERRRIIRFILRYRMQIMRDPLAPKRDKAAMVLLYTNYHLYKAFWTAYLATIFKKEK